MECFLWLIMAGMASILFFLCAELMIEQQIDDHYMRRNVTRNYNEKYIEELQNFITRQHVSSKNLEVLDEWVNDNRLVYIQIKKDDKWIYSSDYGMDEEAQPDDYDIPVYPADSYYDVELNDGTVKIFIMGMYSYRPYMFALITDIIVSFCLFFFLVMLGVRKKIKYIDRLSRDILILEGGDLQYEVHVQGNDEITDLAKGLNAMKDSFKNQMEEVENLTRKNQEMVTEISHDLRTPLTSVLLYAEILQNEKYGGEENKRDYLEKIIRRVQHMKELSDKLLAYAVQPTEEMFIPAVYLPIRSSLYDELSDMCGYLEERGINVKADMQWKEGSIFIYKEYLVRILDNIASNILKYADKQALVLIWDEYYADEMLINFENACSQGKNDMDSYSIGIRNVKMMMEEIGGTCEVVKNREQFRICLRFRYKKADRK